MGRKGIAGTTTQEIARRAGCSQAAIYKHWESKETLARESFDDAQRGLLEAMEAGSASGRTPGGRIEGALLGFLSFARNRPGEYAFLFQVFHSDFARWLADHAMPRDIVVREIQAGMRSGDVPAGDVQLKAALLLGMTIRVAFFEKQRLVGADAAATATGLRRAIASVLRS